VNCHSRIVKPHMDHSVSTNPRLLLARPWYCNRRVEERKHRLPPRVIPGEDEDFFASLVRDMDPAVLRIAAKTQAVT
jgi:hypothetical protein